MLVQLGFFPLSPQKKGMILKKERKGGFLCTSFFFRDPQFPPISFIPLASPCLPLWAFISSSTFLALPLARTNPFNSHVFFPREFHVQRFDTAESFLSSPSFHFIQLKQDRNSRGKRLNF